MQLTWLGHSAFHLETARHSILIDPFFTGNPKHPQGYEDQLEKVDTIVLTHGHEDHLGDTVRLAKKYGSTVVAQYEICMFVNGQGVENLQPMNTGGCIEHGGVVYCMVPAVHLSSKSPIGVAAGGPVRANIRGMAPALLLITIALRIPGPHH